jgi:pimeloyl-ACP methyl ester carboxylesterase
MIRFIAVAGTHAMNRGDAEWDNPDSPLTLFLRANGVSPLTVSPLKRYAWSTAIDGLDKTNGTWDAAGRALAHYIVPPLAEKSLLPPKETFIIAHSHGGNVVAYACGKYGLKVNGLITVATPVRDDLHDLYEAASCNIERHLHLYAGWRDYMQILGSIMDGSWGIHRKMPYAKNKKMPGGHGNILRDPKLFEYWVKEGWLDYFKGK